MRARLPAAAFLLAACGAATPAPPGPPPSLVTEAERSGWTRTGRHAEAVRLCDAFAQVHPARARCERFGVSPEGRELVALVVGGDGAVTPEQVRAGRRPVILVSAGIHAGEIDGKDAGFWLLRDLLDGAVAAGALDAVTIVFVPIFNVDGHERFGPNHRPNQRGPEEMGWRATAANLNLNRDHTKVDAPEMAALLGLWRRWDPVMYVDLHATDGAQFEHDVAVLVEPRVERDDALDDAARALSNALQARLTALGHLPLDFYPAFVAGDDPASGFERWDGPPRFSQAYAATRDRVGVLVETHSWRTYPERVRATYHVLQALLERAVADAAGWRAAADAADARDLVGRDVVLSWQLTGEARTIEFRGYAYERRASEVSGGTWTIYDETRPEMWRVPLREAMAPALTVRAPRGYVVAAGYADAIAPRLAAHGLRHVRLDAEVTLDAEVWRATAVTPQPPFEGRTRMTLAGGWTRERRTLAPGALWVPIAQPGARLVLHLMEPAAPDSFAAWGFFNAAFEAKEYLEAYVAETIARVMLEDPAVKAAFEEALQDPAFAASPARRLEWFHRRYPSWDDRRDLVPVMRLDQDPTR